MTDIFEPESIYHIYNRAIGDERLFRAQENYFYFLEKYQHYLGEKLDTLAYCLIPNHYHFLVKIKKDSTNDFIVKAFSDFQNSFSKSINKAYGRNGALFQRKFKRKKISMEDYLSRIIIYIHQNPVKHQLTKNPADWKYSSFKSYFSEKPSKLDRRLVLEWLGGLEGFQKSHEANTELYLPEELILE